MVYYYRNMTIFVPLRYNYNDFIGIFGKWVCSVSFL